MNESYLIKAGKNSSKNLLVLLPGLMTDARTDIVRKILKTKNRRDDVLTFTLYNGINNLDIDFQEIISLANETIKKYSTKYETLTLIGHSFGSTVIFLLKLQKKVKKIIFWSPSYWRPNSVVPKLGKKGGYLILGDRLINKKFAGELEVLDIKSLITNLKGRDLVVYLSRGDSKSDWTHILKENPRLKYKIIKTKYRHNYTNKEFATMLNKAEIIAQCPALRCH